ncbi:MAG: sodium:proton antiporter [Clostridia bacterium]|nr:sodium:proton antiporter [Clostridia bacterium]
MSNLYNILYTAALVIIGLLVIACLIRAIRGPRIADRVIAINMIGTLIVITICILSFMMQESYLVDIAMIYTMLSFLAVVLLTKVYMGVYREKHRQEQLQKEGEQHD